MAKALRIITILLLSLNSALAAIPKILISPLLLNKQITLPSGWISISLAGEQSNGYGLYSGNNLYIPSPMFFSNSMDLTINYGLSEKLDFLIDLNYVQNKSSMQKFDHIGDTSVDLGYQITSQNDSKYKSDIRLDFSLTIPTGKYNNLNPLLFTNDATGAGSFQPAIGFSFSHDFKISDAHTLTAYSNLELTYAYRVTLSGVNAYGGAPGTRGKMRPGNSVSILIGTSFNLTDKWTASMEYSVYAAQPSSFRGVIAENLEEYIAARLKAIDTTSVSGVGYSRPRILFNLVFPTIHNIGGQNFLGSGAVTSLSVNPSLSYDITDSYNLLISMSLSIPGGKNTTGYYAPSITLTKTISS